MIVRQIKDYLYELRADGYNYKIGFDFFKKYRNDPVPAGCSAVRKGNYIGRNFDWYYDEYVDFVVTTRHKSDKLATIGVAHSFGNITNQNLKDGLIHNYELLPIIFNMSDCMNEKGVYCSLNVVPVGDKQGTTPIGNGPGLCQLMIPRLVCDYAETADEAVSMLEQYQIYAALGGGVNEECHVIIADKENTYDIEFLENEMKVMNASEPFPNILTNFYMSGWNWQATPMIASKTLGNTDEEIEATGLTDHAMGLERYLILADMYPLIADENGLTEAMKSVRYSKAYDEDNFWYSEFYSQYQTFGDLTIHSSREDMAGIKDYVIGKYEEHKRDRSIWITTHTSVYDFENMLLRVYAQENYDDVYEIAVDTRQAHGIDNIDELFPNSQMP